MFSVRGAQGVIHHFRVNQILAPPRTLLSSDEPATWKKKLHLKWAAPCHVAATQSRANTALHLQSLSESDGWMDVVTHHSGVICLDTTTHTKSRAQSVISFPRNPLSQASDRDIHCDNVRTVSLFQVWVGRCESGWYYCRKYASLISKYEYLRGSLGYSRA